MAGRVSRWLLVTVFATAVGQLAWHALIGPPAAPDYYVDGPGTVFTGTDPCDKSLYLRRTFSLTRPPRHAWVHAVAWDEIRLYVNGKLQRKERNAGFPVAVVADVTSFLKVGRNVIAVSTEQKSADRPPSVAIKGAMDEDAGLFEPGPAWRCSPRFERTGHWWFEREFDDQHWAAAGVTAETRRAKASEPPEPTASPRLGRWITPATPTESSACFRRELEIIGRPRQAWVTVATTAPFRLAVNGVLLVEEEASLGTDMREERRRHGYDVTAVIRQGKNVISLSLLPGVGPPHLLAEVGVTDSSGQAYQAGTDGGWLSHVGIPPDWCESELRDAAGWMPPVVETGDLNLPPWQLWYDFDELSLPLPFILRQALGQLGLIVVLALVVYVLCGFADWCLARCAGSGAGAGVATLALVPATVGVSGGLLAAYDPRIGTAVVYQPGWILLALLSVPVQWVLLAILSAYRRRTIQLPTNQFDCFLPAELELEGRSLQSVRRWPSGRALLAGVLMAVLVVIGFALRLRGIEAEPIHWDEIDIYTYTLGVFERGYPSRQIHESLPIKSVTTSEFVFPFTALAGLFFNDPRWVVRFPAVCWGTLTIILIYVAGRRMFNRPVGLVAALLYTVAPACIAMASFGRYFAQLQFFCLLTVYALWLAVRGFGPLNRRAWWVTIFSSCALFLSWEGGGMMGPGLALAVLLQRRGRLRTLVSAPALWVGLWVMVLVLVLQQSHRNLEQVTVQVIGTTLRDFSLKPAWNYPESIFRPWYYIWRSGWSEDALFPMIGLVGAGLLALRHPNRRAIRFVLIIHLGTCLFMTMFVTQSTWRYIHHIAPLTILLTSVVLVALARSLARSVQRVRAPAVWPVYARGVGWLVVLAAVVLGSGLTLRLAELSHQRVFAQSPWVLRNDNLDGPTDFVRARFRPGDIVICNHPQNVNLRMERPGWYVDYKPADALARGAVLDPIEGQPRDRYANTVVLTGVNSLQEVFARHPRIWYIAVPMSADRNNTAEMSAFLRQHMDVVYEDYHTLVLLRDANHRSADLRMRQESALHRAEVNFLP